MLFKKLFHVEALFESIYTSAGVNKLLLTGIERMTFRTNFNTNIFTGRSGLNHLAASTGDCRFLIIGMDTFFHIMFSPLLRLDDC